MCEGEGAEGILWRIGVEGERAERILQRTGV